MLLEIAIGDAYGAGFECVSADIVQARNDLSCYVPHPTHKIKPGCYTDDAQMSIAVAEAIVSGQPWTAETLADHFVAAFKRDPREGYANSFYSFLHRVRDGHAFLRDIRPDSDKSSAAMRSCPTGVFSTVAQVQEKCALQASLTHNTPDGIDAAVAVGLMTHYFLYQIGARAEVGRWLEQNVPGQRSQPWRGKVGSRGWMSVRAAVTAIMGCDSLSTLLKAYIAYTGDVDTVAAIALGAGSCCREIAQDLPCHLIDTLEDGPYGRGYLIDLDHRLLNCVARKQGYSDAA